MINWMMMFDILICVNSSEITDVNPGVYFSAENIRKLYLYYYFLRRQVKTWDLKGVAAFFTYDSDYVFFASGAWLLPTLPNLS